MNFFTPLPIVSPCVGVCQLGDDGLCDGCLRTGDEIAAWIGMTAEQRAHVMDVVIPARAAGIGA